MLVKWRAAKDQYIVQGDDGLWYLVSIDARRAVTQANPPDVPDMFGKWFYQITEVKDPAPELIAQIRAVMDNPRKLHKA